MTLTILGLDPLWLLLGHEERTLSYNVNRGCAVELSISWYKGMWNRAIEEVGIDFLKDYHGLHEADVAEYAAGKNILVSDFLEFVETEVDLEDLFRYPERDIGMLFESLFEAMGRPLLKGLVPRGRWVKK